MRVRLAALLVIFAAMVSLAFAQDAPWHYSNCPVATNCCVVPVPLQTEPVPGGTPTVVPQAALNLYGVHVSNQNAAAVFFQLFNGITQPAAGATPFGASSWYVAPTQDRDLVIGELRGMSFTVGIEVCCSSTQGTFTSVGGCGVLIQYY